MQLHSWHDRSSPAAYSENDTDHFVWKLWQTSSLDNSIPVAKLKLKPYLL